MATELDPSIILAGGQINDPTRLLSLAKMSQELRQTQQKAAGQNALKQLFASPGAIDAQGNPTPETIQKTMQVDPETGMQLQSDTLTAKVKAAQAKHYETEAGTIKFDTLSGIAGIATDAYDAAKKAGKSEQDAVSAATAARNEAIKDNGGAIGDQDAAAAMASPFDPATAKTFAMANPDYAKRISSDKKDTISQEREDEHERHDEATESRMAGAAEAAASNGRFVPYQEPDRKDDKGNVIPGRTLSYNTKTGRYSDAEGNEAVPGRIEKIGAASGGNSTLGKEDLDFYADQILAGDKSALQNVGRGTQGAANLVALRKAVREKAEAQGITGKDLAAVDAEFSGTQAGERTLGTRTANVGLAVDEAKSLAPLAIEASRAVSRTKFTPLNSALQAVESGSSDPDLARFVTANNSLINVYARGISPTGVPTVSDKDHGREMLSTAKDQASYEAVVNQMMKELAAAQTAPGQVRGELSEAVTGKSAKASAEGAHKIGDIVIQGGKKYRATEVKDGKVTSAEEIE